VLGGAVGALADPFQLMNMAQNDIEGLQNTILEAASAAVTFNETTGKFQIGATEMRRLRAQAEALGMNYEELANTATKTAERNQKLDYLQFLDVTDEQREMLASIGQVEGGELKVMIKEPDEEGKLRNRLISAAEAMNDDNYKKQLESMFNEANMDDRQIAVAQMNALEAIQKALEEPLIQIQAQVAGSEAFTELRKVIKGTADAVGTYSKSMIGENGEVFSELITNSYNNFSEKITELTNNLGETDTYEGIYKNVVRGGKELGKYMVDGAMDMWTMMKTQMTTERLERLDSLNLPSLGSAIRGVGGNNDSSGDYTVTNPLPANLAKVENDVTVKIDPLTMNFEDLNVNHGGTIQLQGVGGVDLNNLTSTQLQELSRKLKTYMDPSNILGT
jgi:hypothetical protein